MSKTIIGVIIGVMVIGGLIALAMAQNNTDSTDSSEGLQVATSFYPLEFALERITGDLGRVTNIGANKDPHDFEPTTRDILALQSADVVVLQGAEFEPWSDSVKAQLESEGVPVIIATADISLGENEHKHEHGDEHQHEENHDEHEHEEYEKREHGHEEEKHEHEDVHDDHDHGALDPHTWLDPVLFSETVEHLTEEIVQLDPDNAATYRSNAEQLMSELMSLNTDYSNRLANCQLDEVIISHDAFGYVADRYEFTVHTITGLSTQDTPSATTLAELRAEAEEGIGAILLEQNSVTAYGETLARETGLQTLSISPIAYNVPSGEDYLSLMQANLDTFATALRCNE